MGMNNDRTLYALSAPPTQYLTYIGNAWAFTDGCITSCQSDAILLESEGTTEYDPTAIGSWKDSAVVSIIHENGARPRKCGINVLFTDAEGNFCDNYHMNGIYYNDGHTTNNHAEYRGNEINEPPAFNFEYRSDGNGGFRWELREVQFSRDTLYFYHTSTGTMDSLYDITKLSTGPSSWKA
eukprot:737934_1